MKVTDLIGNSFKLQKDIKAYKGSPNSNDFVIWKAGRRTDPVYSWVTRGGEVWYMFGRQQPSYFIKHDPAALEPVAEQGAAKYLNKESGGSSFLSNALGVDLSLNDLGAAAKLAGGLILLLITFQIVGFINELR